jgi:hypothetical protein
MRTPVILPIERAPVRLEDLPPSPRPLRTPVRLDAAGEPRPEDLIWMFVAERHDVFINRVIERRPAPWTDDGALANWHYTNVYRELDRVTLDLRRQAIEPYVTCPPQMRIFNIIVYRVFNEPATFYTLLPYLSWTDPVTIERLLLERQTAGLTNFRAAYRVQSSRESGEGARTRTWVRRLQAIAGSIPWRELEVAGKHPDRQGGMRWAHALLTGLPGIGPFLAYEILVDLCYDPAVLPFTENDWVNVGPGAADGLSALGLSPTEASIRALAQRQREGFARVGRVLRGPDLTLRNIEHCCCELSKYMRARAGGRNKRRFTLRAESHDFSPWEGVDPKYWQNAEVRS